jgi:hypothetical protein
MNPYNMCVSVSMMMWEDTSDDVISCDQCVCLPVSVSVSRRCGCSAAHATDEEDDGSPCLGAAVVTC